jgi:hypothetical protein
MQRSWREGWYGSGADYNVNPVMGWGDSPGATTEELIHALARFDPQGLAQALGATKTTRPGLPPSATRCCPAICTAWTCTRPWADEMPPLPDMPVRARWSPCAPAWRRAGRAVEHRMRCLPAAGLGRWPPRAARRARHR